MRSRRCCAAATSFSSRAMSPRPGWCCNVLRTAAASMLCWRWVPPTIRHSFANSAAIGLAGDAEKARALYQHAQELGSQEASRRIERLSQMQ